MILPLKPAVIGPFSGIFHRLPQKVSQQSCHGSAMVVGIWVGLQKIFFCWLRLCFFLRLSFLVPFALYLQGTRICHFAWYLLRFGMVTLHFAWYLLHFGMVTLHFAWHLLHLAMFAFHFAWNFHRFGTSTSHLHGICYILVLQTFMCFFWEFL